MSKNIVVAFGRFNPPTCGHAKVWARIAEIAVEKNADGLLCMSKSNDPKSNPIAFLEKRDIIEQYLQELDIDISVEPDEFANLKTMYQILPAIYKMGYEKLYYVCGSDRFQEFSRIKDYNGKPLKNPDLEYNFKVIEIASAGERIEDPDDIVARASGTKMRAFAALGEFDKFREMTPDFGENEELAYRLFELCQEV